MKKRLDVLLVERNIAPSRQLARAYIMSGTVFVNGVREDKAGGTFDERAEIEYMGKPLRYVSRGGLKLEKAIEVFGIDLNNKVCMDIGASTGGFTDCMIQNGARKVYSIDVGYGQLDWSLRSDERVVCIEKTNFRYMTPGDIPETPDFASCDVSFISLSKILPPAAAILSKSDIISVPDADETALPSEMVCLIKPQFEAGREKVGKKGVVRDKAVHIEVIYNVMGFAEREGFFIKGLDYSPIRGPEGNIEYLLYLVDAHSGGRYDGISVENTVERAHGALESRV